MPAIRLRRPYAAIALAAAVACTADPVVLCGCSLPAPFTVVYGIVTAPGGAKLPGVTVRSDVGPAGCQSAVESRELVTDADGRFRVMASAAGTDAQMCVRLVARAPATSGLADSDTARVTIPTPRQLPPDSVRQDLALRTP